MNISSVMITFKSIGTMFNISLKRGTNLKKHFNLLFMQSCMNSCFLWIIMIGDVLEFALLTSNNCLILSCCNQYIVIYFCFFHTFWKHCLVHNEFTTYSNVCALETVSKSPIIWTHKNDTDSVVLFPIKHFISTIEFISIVIFNLLLWWSFYCLFNWWNHTY